MCMCVKGYIAICRSPRREKDKYYSDDRGYRRERDVEVYGQRYAARTPEDGRQSLGGVDARQSQRAVLPLPPGPPARASQKVSGVKNAESDNPSSTSRSGNSSQSGQKRKSDDVSGDQEAPWKGSSSPAPQPGQERGEALDEPSSGHESSRASSPVSAASPHAPGRAENGPPDSVLNGTQERYVKGEKEGRGVDRSSTQASCKTTGAW